MNELASVVYHEDGYDQDKRDQVDAIGILKQPRYREPIKGAIHLKLKQISPFQNIKIIRSDSS